MRILISSIIPWRNTLMDWVPWFMALLLSKSEADLFADLGLFTLSETHRLARQSR